MRKLIRFLSLIGLSIPLTAIATSDCFVIDNVNGYTPTSNSKQLTHFNWIAYKNGRVLATGLDTADDKYQNCQKTDGKNQFIKDWLLKSALQAPPQSAIGQAITYNLNQWQKLIRYVDNGHLNIDNNRAERAVKPFVIGRKNWLFANTASGANASAVLYSIIETAKANGLTPFNYLMHLLEELPKMPEDLEPLMPWNVQLEQNI